MNIKIENKEFKNFKDDIIISVEKELIVSNVKLSCNKMSFIGVNQNGWKEYKMLPVKTKHCL